MYYAKLQGQQTSGSGEDFLKVFTRCNYQNGSTYRNGLNICAPEYFFY